MLKAIGVFTALLLFWELFCLTQIIPEALLPSPPQVAKAFIELLYTGMPPGHRLPGHALYSLGRVLAGTGLAVLCGVPTGLVLGSSPKLRSLFMPVINFLRPIPPLAWIPLAILWFGLGFASAVYLIFLGAFFPIVLSTCSGVNSVDRLFVDSVRIFGAKQGAIWLKVLLPGAMPSILTGIRVGLGIGWMTLVAAEFTGIRGGYGLGYMIMNARDLQRTDEVMAGMAAIGIIGLGMEYLMGRLAKHLLRWQ
ncbi:MAG: ABC transporter permease [Desulfovibrio sp.]|jgi:ABC-type nitrate/sulfonate/bicarbonate transport system permease component|nr:ABC transporter permease [Desulfovibrio sp.]